MDLLFMVGLATVLLMAVIFLTIGWHLAHLPILLGLVAVLLATHRLLTRVQRQLAASNQKPSVQTEAAHSHRELSYRGVAYPAKLMLEPPALEQRPPLEKSGKYRGCRWQTTLEGMPE